MNAKWNLRWNINSFDTTTATPCSSFSFSPRYNGNCKTISRISLHEPRLFSFSFRKPRSFISSSFVLHRTSANFQVFCSCSRWQLWQINKITTKGASRHGKLSALCIQIYSRECPYFLISFDLVIISRIVILYMVLLAPGKKYKGKISNKGRKYTDPLKLGHSGITKISNYS